MFIENKSAVAMIPSMRYELSGSTMGTRYSVVFYMPEHFETRDVSVQLQTVVDRVDAQMSTWKPASDLMRFNHAPKGVWVTLPPDVLEVLQRAEAIRQQSDGAFDISVGDLVNAWGFGAACDTPNAKDIALLLNPKPETVTRCVEIDSTLLRARKMTASNIDLCGIAKGFGVDKLAQVLEAHGIWNYLVSIDGEMRARGIRAEGLAWTIAIEAPDAETRRVERVLELSDVAVATSGDYRHCYQLGEQIISHTMDGKAGRPVCNALASVTVIAPNCTDADAWATALWVLGEVEGPKLARRLGMDALFMSREGSAITHIAVGRFEAE